MDDKLINIVSGLPRSCTSIIPDCLFYKNAHSAPCWTLPSTASLFTGKYPYQHGKQTIRCDDLNGVLDNCENWKID